MLDGEVLVAQGDTILYHRQSTYIQTTAPCNPQFMIASISKHFTAVALLKALYDTSSGLDDAEKCAHVIEQLQKPIIAFLPPERFAWGPTIPDWAYHITLHHLLSHTSGMVQHVRIMFERVGYEGFDTFFRKCPVSEIIQQFGHEPVQFAPGSGYSYSNLGYELLAEVITITANMPYSEYLQQHIFDPYGMHSTCNPKQGSSYHLKQLPSCSRLAPEMFYDATNDMPEPRIPAFDILSDIGSSQGAGSIISTVHDLWQWNRVLHELKSVLPESLYALLIQPKFEFNQHAYGIWNRNGIMHTTGRCGAYTSQLLYIPQHNISIVMLCHVSRDEAIMHKKYMELETELSTAIEDTSERQKRVHETLEAQYPLQRGSVLMGNYLHKLVDLWCDNNGNLAIKISV